MLPLLSRANFWKRGLQSNGWGQGGGFYDERFTLWGGGQFQGVFGGGITVPECPSSGDIKIIFQSFYGGGGGGI
jgi:hypothetical protein